MIWQKHYRSNGLFRLDQSYTSVGIYWSAGARAVSIRAEPGQPFAPVPNPNETQGGAPLHYNGITVPGKTFYIETFGCQMNVHDSEKVIGTLMAEGYSQVPTPEDAHLVLYNTCSIRDKAEQKVFNRLQNFKRDTLKGKIFGVLGCVAQQEGEKIFDRAPHVSLVAGSASYTRLGEMLVQLEAGNRRVTGLSLDTDETFDTPFTRRDNPHRAYITIIEGCDKHCAYCVVPFTRGPERSRTSQSVIAEASRLAADGYTEIQLLGQNVNSYRDPSPAGWDFARLLASVAEVPGIRRVRYTTSHPRDFVKSIVDAMDANPAICDHVHLPVQSGSTRVLAAMDRLYTRDDYMRRIEWIKSARRSYALTTDIIVGFPGETEKDFEETLQLLDEVQYASLFSFKYSPRPNTAALEMGDRIPEDEKQRRLIVLQEKQRAIQIRNNARLIGGIQEVLVEGRHQSLGQWIGRTSCNRTLNFTHYDSGTAAAPTQDLNGAYLPVRVTRSGPNSLVGESVSGECVSGGCVTVV
jgi:tRNA-2-methylthio-N6-dimethylallyladenosine synthase